MENMEIIAQLISGLIGALIGATVSMLALYVNFRRSLDEASGWRKKLFDAASAPAITLEQVYVLRTALRYEPSPSVEEYTFNWLCNIMIYYCDYLSLKYAPS